jgi:hypothetical protein
LRAAAVGQAAGDDPVVKAAMTMSWGDRGGAAVALPLGRRGDDAADGAQAVIAASRTASRSRNTRGHAQSSQTPFPGLTVSGNPYTQRDCA